MSGGIIISTDNFKKTKRILQIILGSFISAISINTFTIPHGLISSGVGGIAIIIQYIFGIPAGILIFLLNIPIFLIGMREIDREFIVYSLIGMISLSAALILTQSIGQYIAIDDVLLSSIFAGIIGGIGVGTVFNARGSQGGTDILAVVFKKKTGMDISALTFIMNLIVVLVGALLSTFEVALYTLISIYIFSRVIDMVIQGTERKKLLFIITNQEKDVTNAILKELKRGVTFLYGEGAYTGDKKKILYCIVNSKQLVKVKSIVQDADPGSFMTIIDAGEVQGKGFQRPVF